MGEYGRTVIDFLVIVSAPTLAPHLDVVALAVIALALVVALVLAFEPAVFVLARARRVAGATPVGSAGVSRVIRSLRRARAPSVGMLLSRA